MIDARMLKASQKFKELSDSYVIFITEKDVLGQGNPLYHVERTILETNRLFGDGSHIIYVNGAYTGDTQIGRLMHDFKCTKSEDMYYSELSEGVKHFKESEEGRKGMCETVEEYANKKAEKAAKKAAKRATSKATQNEKESTAVKMIKMGKYSLEDIIEITGLSLAKVQSLKKSL